VATKPTIASVAIGAKVSAALWNAQVYTGNRFQDVTKPVCHVYQTVAQAPASAAWTPITFDSEYIDTDNQHSTVSNTNRIVIGNTLGWYRVSANVAFNGDIRGRRGGRIGLNGSAVPIAGSQIVIPAYAQNAAGAATGYNINVTSPPVLIQATLATDYVELQGFQDTGVALNTTVGSGIACALIVEYVGTLA
jgi:hypothetical protein